MTLSVEPVGAIIVGVLTGIGGGIARDLLVGEIPFVLRRDVYASRRALGRGRRRLGLPAWPPLGLCGAVCRDRLLVTRVLAWRRGWNPQRVRANDGLESTDVRERRID